MIGIIPIADVLAMLSEDTDGYDVAASLDGKRETDGYADLVASVRRDGITLPILIRTYHGTPWLADGHHRIAAAIDCGHDTIPWTDIPLAVEQNPFDPYTKAGWGPFRPDETSAA